MKKIILFLTLLLMGIYIPGQQVQMSQSTGWLESIILKWQPVSGASSYNVYYTGNGLVDVKIDDQLIRSYGSYLRADILGLKAGTYSVKVKPVISGTEGAATTVTGINVIAHDRNGFAFDSGNIPGGYNLDGTPKSGAVILYISENTKNTISMNITGATTNPCVGLQNILYGIKKGKETRPFIIRLIGNITDFTVMDGGDIVIENANNSSSPLTIEGVGDDAVANGWGIRLKTASNVEVRNLGFMNCNSTAGDNIGLQQDNDHVWVHNNDLFYGNAGSDADQIKGDGALDNKSSTYITFSYNHFWDNGKASLLGLSEGTTTGLYITYHHNWFDHSDSRHPRVRYYSAHIYNNYYDGNAKYGAGSTLGSSLFMEGNYFRSCKYPMLTSKQGTDIYYDSTGTFSGEAGGTIKAFNNYMIGQTRYVTYDSASNPIEFDAIQVNTRDEVISSSIKSKLGSNTYNNFDTNSSFYIKNLVIDGPETAKNKVMQYAGRTQGGDLQWTFNNTIDDTSDTIITALKSTLTNYTGSLVSIQGDGTPIGTPASEQTLTSSGGSINQTVPIGNAISPIVYTWGGDATDANVTGIPASGLIFTKNSSTKTITISGIPTADVAYTVTTIGTGTAKSISGAITISGNNPVTTGDEIHNFTTSGKTSSFYSITGNLSTTKGTVIYNGLTLTQCLKMESTTNISYTTLKASTLTLVFVESAATVYVDGVSYTATNGIVSIPLNAGNHIITKNATANLFYISTKYVDTTVDPQTLSSPANANQTVAAGVAIAPIVYTWGGAASDVTVTGIPASGLTVAKDTNAKTVTISGTPTASVTYSLTTTGEGTSTASASGTITVITQTLSSPANANQTVAAGVAIAPIVYTWGGAATDITVTGIPASGLTVAKDTNAKTVTISGTPTATVTYSLSTTGEGTSTASASGTITVITQTLSSPANTNQTVAAGVAIAPIVYTWGGAASDVTVTGIPASGLTVAKDTNAKTVTISGTPTASVTYSLTTTGEGTSTASASGTITVITQTLSSPANANQTVAAGVAIAPIVYTWGGAATDVTVTGIPASGLTVAKDTNAKTVTISGTPTASVTYSLSTTGEGTSTASASGTITVTAAPASAQIHNFTLSGKNSSYFTIIGNLSTTKGTVNYNGLTLTQCLKMESGTSVNFNAAGSINITLVFNSNYTGTILIDNVSYTAISGIVNATLAAGNHSITKGGISNLYYISVNPTTSARKALISQTESNEAKIYPNPIIHDLNIKTSSLIQKIEIYTMAGQLIKTFVSNSNQINLSSLNSGTYVVKIYTEKGVYGQNIIKK